MSPHEYLNHSFTRLPHRFFPTKRGILLELNKHALDRQCLGEKNLRHIFQVPVILLSDTDYGVEVSLRVLQEILGSECEGIYEEVPPRKV